MGIDEKAFDAALMVLDPSPYGTFDMLDSGNIRNFLFHYESAKQSNLLALLQSPEVVHALEYYAHPGHYEPFVTLSGEHRPGVLTEGGSKARKALAAITSFIEGDDGTKARTKGNPAAIGQTTLAADAPEADCAQPSPTSYAGKE